MQQTPEADPAVVTAVGRLTEALETVERARGHLYSFHQLTGTADLTLDDAIDQLAAAGHHDLAKHVRTELVGRNVLPGRWTFQIVEEYDEGYYRCFGEIETLVRERLLGGRRHAHEAALKQERRTKGHPAHSPEPPEGPPLDEAAAPPPG
jgi:hypothetical protein